MLFQNDLRYFVALLKFEVTSPLVEEDNANLPTVIKVDYPGSNVYHMLDR